MWDLMLTGNHSAQEILNMANEEWGFRTKKSRKRGGKELSRTAIYKMFTNPFYAGIITWRGEEYPELGKHKQMITPEEYDRVQALLGRKGKQRPKIRQFPFTGVIQCGECGCQITAVIKNKLIKSTKEIREYTYYHCTGRKKDYKCSQTQVITAGGLEEQIEREIAGITLDPEFGKLARKIIEKANDKEIHTRTNIYEMQQQATNDTQKQLDNLTQMRLKDFITDEEYATKRNELKLKLDQLRKSVKETEERADDWLKTADKIFNFAVYAHCNFEKGVIKIKKEILMALGCNFILKDRKLTIEARPWFSQIENNCPSLEKEFKELELDKYDINSIPEEKQKGLENIRIKLSGRQDLNLRPLAPETSALSN